MSNIAYSIVANGPFLFSKLSGNTDTTPVHLSELRKVITEENWSPSIYKENYRNIKNFAGAGLVALDVDEGMPLAIAAEMFRPFKHIIATTRSHQKQKGEKSPCDRYRIILFLADWVTDAAVYRATVQRLLSQYSFADRACSDPARMFFPSQEIISEVHDGKLIEVVLPVQAQATPITQPLATTSIIKGTLAKKTRAIINGEWTPEPGKRNPTMYKAALDMRQNNYSLEETLAALAGKSSLDLEEERQVVENGWNREPQHGPRLKDNTPAISALIASESRKWALGWITTNGLSVSYSRMLHLGRETVTIPDVLRKMRLESADQGARVSFLALEDTLREWIEDRRKSHLAAIKEQIQGVTETGPAQLVRFCETLFGTTNPRLGLYTTVMQHFIWQVKRKLFHMPATYHLMPVVVGGQGVGKTEALNRLLGPLSDLVAKPNGFGMISDSREGRVFEENFIVFFDEMAQAERADVNELKNKISAEIVEYRILGSHDRAKVSNNATFLGASNRSIRDTIMDPTGARRFFELNTQATLDWEAVNEIDYKDLWCAVDEQADAPLKTALPEIRRIQESEFRHLTPIEEWIEGNGVERNTGKMTQATVLLDAFNRWYGAKYTATAFGKELRRLGVGTSHGRGGTLWDLKMPSDGEF